MRDYVIIDHIQGGQPRPYADAVYSAYISKRREGVLTNGGKFYIQLQENDVREMARLFVRPFKDNPEYSLMPYLAEIRIEEPTTEMIEECASAGETWKPQAGTRWFVKVIQPYTD